MNLVAVDRSGASAQVRVEVVGRPLIALKMSVAGAAELEFPGKSLFKCLMDARLWLESEDLLLCCQGSRPDVFPSGMLQQMNDGRFAYVLTPGSVLSEDDVVDIFSPADVSDIGTVAEQKAKVMEFFRLSE
ncbi:hypothetical protein GXW83_02860 [Streptacidiphilus sp. PB12-B1b]|uniref:hypothetical protein n=1 Tax=Streptacidiphilus sp. PB12-B1b TaxID=2705012 RepID=UPI0015FE1992|nr:hypothetical protein [Streptacidiphilus sp. PB12-B1b]QMU74869.1 hypothetical protein GXW83_02860 [Streptacidiphilus sp. PB12-B1b]